MEHTHIDIINARVNNLKNLSVSIPKRQLVVISGVSGSGKSSLLFDTMYTEAQRQLVETFSAFARNRLPKLSRPDVDDIRNLSTAILIDQKKMGHNLRSTVGTATEALTYLRLLYSRMAQPFIGPSYFYSFNHPEGFCPDCHGLGTRIVVDRERLIKPELSLREGAIDHPECRIGGFLWRELLSIELFDPDKKLKDYSEEERRLLLDTEPIPVNKKHGASTYIKNWEGLARRLERLRTEKAEGEAAEDAKDAYERYFRYAPCAVCDGTRLNQRARTSLLRGRHIGELCRLEITELIPFLHALDGDIAVPILRKALHLLENLEHIGVGYLSLERPTASLSGGESQRVKTARQLGCDLTELLYILDEPSAGLHPRDTEKLMDLLIQLRDRGNSVYVVEHDPDIIRLADWVVDMGPRAGIAGGEIVYNGPIAGLEASDGVTARQLSAPRRVPPSQAAARLDPRVQTDSFLPLRGASAHNLRGIDIDIPKALFTGVTGVAGSGKSSLIHDCFKAAYPQAIVIDQAPIGRTSRGNLATYTGVFDAIRAIFAAETGQDASLFSFNSRGACPKCSGQGFISAELFFLDAVRTRCDECDGRRYKKEVLEYRYRGKNIDEVLAMSTEEARSFFNHRKINSTLDMLVAVGLDYLKIGQSLSSLSGGEAQRLKIAAELSNSGNIYILDEPTTGLHLEDISKLYALIRKLRDGGNTVIVIEHNLDLIKYADWIIDLGPEGGKNGGRLLYQGPPSGLVTIAASHTGRYLKAYLLLPILLQP